MPAISLASIYALISALNPAFSILTAIISIGIAYATFRRTPKLPEPPITPSSTTILSIDTAPIQHLPGYGPGAGRMGFNRHRRNIG